MSHANSFGTFLETVNHLEARRPPMMDEQAARALAELLPGSRRRRWLLFLIHHPELEAADFVGTLNLAVKAIGGLGTAHITQSHSWDLETEST